MTREETAKCIKVMQAYANGEIIEEKRFSFDHTEWVESIDPSWQWYKFDYRIKPRPKYRPFKDADECRQEMLKHEPFGWVKYQCDFFQIIYVDDNSIGYGSACGTILHSKFEDVFKDSTFADGTPFGIRKC